MPGHEGHRQRIIAKMNAGGLQEHEYLEILLFNAIPRRNTNDLAHRLLDAFGTIPAIFDATIEQLTSVEGIGESTAAYLKCIGTFYNKYSFGIERAFPDYFSEETFMAYINEKYSKIREEVLDFYLLDEQKKFKYCKRFSIGSKTNVKVNPDMIAKLILDFKPKGILMVHNHLTGNCFPSDKDDKTTNQMQIICSIHNVVLVDHFIYSASGIYSYHRAGKMQEISKEYSIGTLLVERK